MEHALIARERLATSVHMRFRRDAGVETTLKELVALEQECCPFLAFTLEKRAGEMMLTISGPESAATLLDDAFGGGGGQAVKTPVRHQQGMGGHGGCDHRCVRGRHLLCAAAGARTIRSGNGHLLTMIGAWIAPYKGLISLVAGAGIACGFLLAYRPRTDQCDGAAPAPPANTRAMKAMLWLALILLFGAIFVP